MSTVVDPTRDKIIAMFQSGEISLDKAIAALNLMRQPEITQPYQGQTLESVDINPKMAPLPEFNPENFDKLRFSNGFKGPLPFKNFITLVRDICDIYLLQDPDKEK